MKVTYLTGKKILPVIINTLIASLYTGYAVGETIFVDKPLVISNNSNDNYNVTSQLTLSPNVSLGSAQNPSSQHIVDVFNDGKVIVQSGAAIYGLMGFKDNSQLMMGIGASTPVTQTGSVILSGESRGTFDNARLTSHDLAPALDLQQNASATLSAHTTIVASGDPGVDAISLIEQARVTLNGSHVTGEGAGIGIYYNASATANNADIRGQINGAYLSGGGALTVSGGSITSLHGGPHPELNLGQYGAGINIIGAASEDDIGLHQGSSKLDVSHGAVITANGSNSAGISSQMYGTSTTDIRVSDSTVSGGKYGILVDNDKSVNSSSGAAGLSTIALMNSIVTGGDDAIHVNAGARANVAIIGPGSQIQGGKGVLFAGDTGSHTNLSIDNASVSGAINNQGTTNVALQNNATWTGTAQNVSTVSLASGTAWNSTGSSVVTGDLNNAGTVVLSDSESPVRGPLTVHNYTGQNGVLVFNNVLTDDNSPTDKLVIQGNSAGTSAVVVNNLGGKGAQTQNGIQLIHVGGQAQGEFVQQGRIVAGAYEYLLHPSDDKKTWYLASHMQSAPYREIIAPPLYRPEVGSYIANQAAANTMFNTQLHDRLGESRYIDPVTGQAGVTTLWLRQVGNHNTFHSGQGNQLRTQSNTYVAQLGGELASGSTDGRDSWHLGIMGGYGENHSNTISTTTHYKSQGTVKGYSVGAYATWLANDIDKTGPYVDTWLQYGWFDNHVNGEQLSDESYKSSGFTASVETGYTFNLGHSGGGENPTYYYIEPNIQGVWMDVRRNDLQESNGTRTQGADQGNLQTRVGTRFFIKGHNKIDNGKDRSFQPFVEVNWIHNTRQFAVNMDGINVSQNGATDIGELKVGVEGQLSKAVQLWGNVGQQMGGKGYSNTTAMLGIKYSFR